MEKNQESKVDETEQQAAAEETAKKAEEAAAETEAKAEEAEPQEEAEAEAQATAQAEAADPTKELNDRLLRLTAEFDNFRKRTQKEKESLYKDAQADTIGKFLDVLDNLERAAAAGGGDEMSKGVQMIIVQFKDVLKKLGVEEIDPAGETFNPDRHYAVSHIDDEEKGENEITSVFQKGYTMGDRVVRFAMVQVAN